MSKEVFEKEDVDKMVDIDFSKVEAMRLARTTGTSVDVVDPKKSEAAFKAQEEILHIMTRARELIWELGRKLSPFKRERQYQYLGYDTFAEWYQNIGLSKSSVYRAINIFETYVEKLGLPEEDVYKGDARKLDRVAALQNVEVDGQPVLNPHTAREWLAKITALSEPDLIKEINEARGVKSMADQLEETDGLTKGCYRLVKEKEGGDQLMPLGDRKIPVAVFKNGSDFYIRIQ